MNKFVQSAVIIAALSSGLASLPSATFAQGAPAPAAAAPQQDRARAHRLPSERIEARLAYMKTALKITPTQEPQWNALADVLRAQAKAMDNRITARRAATPSGTRAPSTAIQRLERRQQMMSDAAAHTGELLAAAKPLYVSLSDDQQKIADDLLSRGRGGHRHGHHG
jgi:hypothetical protein